MRSICKGEEEYQEGWANLKRHDMQVDYIISHTAPTEVMAELGFGGDEEAEYQTDEFQTRRTLPIPMICGGKSSQLFFQDYEKESRYNQIVEKTER